MRLSTVPASLAVVFFFAISCGLGDVSVARGTQPKSPIERANALLDNADAISALAVIDEAIAAVGERSPRAVALLRMKGYIEIILRRDEAAITSFEQVLDLAQGDSFAALELAKRMHAVGRFEEARARYQAFLRAEPDHDEARQNFQALEVVEKRHAALAKKIQRAHRRLYWLAGAAVLVLLSTLTVIRRLCR